jgi:hypothetical protein
LDRYKVGAVGWGAVYERESGGLANAVASE